jgi:purine-nucleoside phosphorylase
VTGRAPAVDITAAAAALRARLGGRPTPETSVVLGSGLGNVAAAVEDPVVVPFTDVPGFPAAGVAGHAGEYVYGTMGSRPVLVQAGRFHHYEGHAMDVVAAPVRVAAALGVRVLVLTNAAGGVDPELEPGDVVLLEDHLNLMFRSPLIGPTRAGEERFPDMSEPYDAALRRAALAAAERLGVPLRTGVYAALTGPSYETAAEVRMLGRLGADVVGMSTVPEVIVARALGLRCLA